MKEPAHCTEAEILEFVTIVRNEAEVDLQGLENRVRAAERLLFLHSDTGETIGVGAIKRPNKGYSSHVFSAACATSNAEDFPFELGWVVVLPQNRGKGCSHKIVSELLSHQPQSFIFATARHDNIRMQKSLQKYGFRPEGKAYKSERGNYDLVLFTNKRVTTHC